MSRAKPCGYPKGLPDTKGGAPTSRSGSQSNSTRGPLRRAYARGCSWFFRYLWSLDFPGEDVTQPADPSLDESPLPIVCCSLSLVVITILATVIYLTLAHIQLVGSSRKVYSQVRTRGVYYLPAAVAFLSRSNRGAKRALSLRPFLFFPFSCLNCFRIGIY